MRQGKPLLPALNADRIILVQTDSTSAKRGAALGVLACLSWSGLNPETLLQARAGLEKLAVGDRLTQAAVEEYWIYMTALKSKRDGEKKLAELKALGIDDGILLEEGGKWQYAISFSAFRTEDDAIVRLNQLKEKGVKTAKILKREALRDNLLIQNADESLVAALHKLQASFAESRLLPVDCKTP